MDLIRRSWPVSTIRCDAGNCPESDVRRAHGESDAIDPLRPSMVLRLRRASISAWGVVAARVLGIDFVLSSGWDRDETEGHHDRRLFAGTIFLAG